jgi:hypothetical protein
MGPEGVGPLMVVMMVMLLLVEVIAGIPPTWQRVAGTTQLPMIVTPENCTISAAVASTPNVAFTRVFGDTTDVAGTPIASPSPAVLH